MINALFLLKSFPAHHSANVVCDEKVIRELQNDERYVISCLARKFYNESSYENVNGVKTFRINVNGIWNKYTWAYDNRESKKGKLYCAIYRLLMRIKQAVFVPLYPIYEPLWTKKYEKEVTQAVIDNKTDILIVDHGGVDDVYVGYKIKKKNPTIKYVVILWDPYIGQQPAKYLPSKYAMKRIEKLGNRCLKEADLIIAMEDSKEYLESLGKKVENFERYKFCGIPGIVKPNGMHNVPRFIQEDMTNIVYTGLLTLPDRDPSPMIEALMLTENAKKINLIFLCAGPGKDKLFKYAREFPGKMVIENYVSQSELDDIYEKADFFINFGGSNSNMVPSKLFTYLSYGKPIISTFMSERDASVRHLDKYPLALCLDIRLTVEQLGKKLDDFITCMNGSRVDFETVQNIYTQNSPKVIVDAINTLLQNRI